MSTDPETTLLDFVDGAPDGASDEAEAAGDSVGGPDVSPAQNADDIQHLVDCVESLTGKLEMVVDRLEELDAAPTGTDAESHDPDPDMERMFQ